MHITTWEQALFRDEVKLVRKIAFFKRKPIIVTESKEI